MHHDNHSGNNKRLIKKNTQSSSQHGNPISLLNTITEIGDYDIVGKLGKGGAGVVWHGKHKETNYEVAIKRIDFVGLSAKEKSDMQKEVNFLKKFDHTNIVKCIDAHDDGVSLNIIMEYVDGGTIIQHISETIDPGQEDISGASTLLISESQLTEFVRQVLLGLTYLHDHNIIHRDIKGANILYSSSGICKLSDFGVAKQMSMAQKTQSVVGTPYWMAPEIIQMSAEQTTACDIWSLGCTAVELLTGQPPYGNCNPMSAMYKVVQNDHPPLPDGISKEMIHFLLQCFQKDPNKRPNAKKLLSHPWLKKDGGATTTIRDSYESNWPVHIHSSQSERKESVEKKDDDISNNVTEKQCLPADLLATREQIEMTLPFEGFQMCSNCNMMIKGNAVKAFGKKWHLMHFKCADCGSTFSADALQEQEVYYYPFKNKPYCADCIQHALSRNSIMSVSRSSLGHGGLEKMHTISMNNHKKTIDDGTIFGCSMKSLLYCACISCCIIFLVVVALLFLYVPSLNSMLEF